MMISGVQPVGAKGVNAVQGAVVDSKDAARYGDWERDGDRSGAVPAKTGQPQPVVFPRKGVPVDPRPVSLRHERATTRYRSDGGNPDAA